ncbi:ABC transporter permease [Sinomonas sp. ASV486]|uniref:ABC transporter permease n=1 Tax=Sinomonas sp. ASV486 TaxID=3051170 RepID=UPI0027DCF4C2|nr:ABC transporter permease [Sinomonas sp. ASV486]MDQ4489801.1 ABC transporter permease [Sinomonas sp. ASV486]
MTVALEAPSNEKAEKGRRHSVLLDYAGLALGLVPIILLYLASRFAPLPFSPTQPNAAETSLAPSTDHWFGTDASGFDVFSRTIDAAGIDLPLAVGGTLLALVIGVPLGLIASSKGWAANVIMRAIDALQALPLLILAVALVALAGNNISSVIVAIVLVSAPGFVRLVRSGALVVRRTRYVEAATAMGCSTARILRVHVLPNVMSLILAQASLGVATAIVVIAGLNFLGVGTHPPDPTWGSMISDGAGVIAQGDWWVALFPSLAIVLVIVCLNAAARAAEDLTKAR